jgi:hypothetical protein
MYKKSENIIFIIKIFNRQRNEVKFFLHVLLLIVA